MPKDHFVAQTYLRSFGNQQSPNFIHAVRKSTLETLQNIPLKSVCYERNWSDSPYHENIRFVEEYLDFFEPKWKPCIEKLLNGVFDISEKNLIAGYLAFLRACTPTAVRIGKPILESSLKTTFEILLKKGKFPPLPEELKSKSETEILDSIFFDVDSNYPKALNFENLVNVQKRFVISEWDILKNETDTLFITSDNPVAPIRHPSHMIMDIFFPIHPRIGIVIKPMRKSEDSGISGNLCDISEKGVKELNKLTIKSAEDLVFFQPPHPWIPKLVKRYKNWRVEMDITKIKHAKGELMIAQQVLKESL